MGNIINLIIIALGIFLSGGCDLIKMKDKNGDPAEESPKPVARVHDQFLYPGDLEGIVLKGISPDDSISLVENYINSWAKKQLMINEASNEIDFNQAELERKILDYRYALMVYEYRKKYINETLNNEVTNQEILDYYEANKDKFELKQNIIKGSYVKVSKEAPGIPKLRSLMNSSKPADEEELQSFCYRFASAYLLGDSVWINFDELIKDTPLIDITNKVDFLRRNRYVTSQDSAFVYHLKIVAYKISDQISPLEFVEDQIREIIINKRKVELANNLEDEVFRKAVNNNDFEIFTDN